MTSSPTSTACSRQVRGREGRPHGAGTRRVEAGGPPAARRHHQHHAAGRDLRGEPHPSARPGPLGGRSRSGSAWASHVYSSSNTWHIARRYVTFGQATRSLPLDGLILTGAPVEELSFEEVYYWPEPGMILQQARRTILRTLGLCWGGLAMAKQLGIDKQVSPKKLFGVYRNRNLNPEAGVLGESHELFWCAHSRHWASATRSWKARRRRRACRAPQPRARDRLFDLPEQRPPFPHAPRTPRVRRAPAGVRMDPVNRALGRTDVEPPRNFDPASPKAVWLSHCETLFSRWLASLRPVRAPALFRRWQPVGRRPSDHVIKLLGVQRLRRKAMQCWQTVPDLAEDCSSRW